MPKTSSADAASISSSKLIHAIGNPTLTSKFKVEEPELSVIKKLSEFFKCAVKPPETQRPQQGNKLIRVEQFTPKVPRVVGETTQVLRLENKTSPTLRV